MGSVQDYEGIYLNKTTGKVTAAVLSRLLFFGCFFASIFMANTIWKSEAAWLGYMHETLVNNLPQQIASGMDVIGTIALQRLWMWLFLLFFGRTIPGMVGAQTYVAWQGFLLGFLMSGMIIRYGFYGIVVFALMGCPQLMVYIPAYMLLYKINHVGWNRKKASQIYGENGFERGVSQKHPVAGYFLATMLFLTGILLECYVNVMFLTKMAELMKIF